MERIQRELGIRLVLLIEHDLIYKTETIGISITKGEDDQWVHTGIKDTLKAYLATHSESTYTY